MREEVGGYVYILASRRNGTLYTGFGVQQWIKRWRRDWKITLIEERNPTWDDFFEVLSQQSLHPSLPGRMPREGGAESRDPRTG